MTFSKSQKFIGIAILLAIVVVLGIIYGPTLRLRWKYNAIVQQRNALLIQEAQNLLPQLSASTNPSLHVLYQDLMREAGRARDVERQYRKWSSQKPDDPIFLAFYSRVARTQKQRRDSLEKAKQIAQNNDAVLMISIEDFLNNGKTINAWELLKKAKSDHWLKWYLQAQIAARQGDNEKTVDSFTKAIESGVAPLYVTFDFARYLTKWTDLSKGSIPYPFAQWRQEQFSQEPLALAYKNWLMRDEFNASLEKMPADGLFVPEAVAILCRPALLSAVKNKTQCPPRNPSSNPINDTQLETIHTLLAQASRIDPHDPEVVVSQGLLALSKNDSDESNAARADRWFGAALHSNPKFSTTTFHVRMADALASAGMLDLAAAHYRKAWGDIPENVYFLKALAAFRKEKEKNNAQTISILEKARSISPRDTKILRELGDMYLEREDRDNAEKVFDDLIVADEHDYYARDAIANIWMDRKNPSRAIQLYAALLNREPDNGYCYARMAKIHLRLNNIPKAENIINQAQKVPNLRYSHEIIVTINDIELAKKEKKN